MKKIVASVLAIAMAAIVLVGCGGGASTTTETKSTTEDTSTGKIAAYTEEDLGKDFVFKHGFDQEFPPYAYRNDNGELSVTTTAGSTSLYRSTGTQRTWSSTPVAATASGLDSPSMVVRTITSGACRIPTTSR